jgi:2-C-methyl-D-erythritol 4-phosphate cytidylyltransferase
MLLKDEPILMHSIKSFYTFDNNMEIRIVLPESVIDSWKVLCQKYNFSINHKIFSGGETRFHSVKNGLQSLEIPCLIAIHDGVRPLVSQNTISNCFKMAEEMGTAVPVIAVKESLRKIIEEDSIAEDRSAFRLVQTPQIFHSDILLNAYNTEYRTTFTDDAGVVESAGFKIYITDGNEENLKITTPKDLLLAEALISNL